MCKSRPKTGQKKYLVYFWTFIVESQPKVCVYLQGSMLLYPLKGAWSAWGNNIITYYIRNRLDMLISFIWIHVQ